MNQKRPSAPAAPPRPADDRDGRLAAALKENLKRRKAQGKARAHGEDAHAPAPQSPQSTDK